VGQVIPFRPPSAGEQVRRRRACGHEWRPVQEPEPIDLHARIEFLRCALCGALKTVTRGTRGLAEPDT
jgi:hypothetical protein